MLDGDREGEQGFTVTATHLRYSCSSMHATCTSVCLCVNGQLAFGIPGVFLDFTGDMETSELQRRLGFPAASLPKLVWYRMTRWSEFRNTLYVSVQG